MMKRIAIFALSLVIAVSAAGTVSADGLLTAEQAQTIAEKAASDAFGGEFIAFYDPYIRPPALQDYWAFDIYRKSDVKNIFAMFAVQKASNQGDKNPGAFNVFYHTKSSTLNPMEFLAAYPLQAIASNSMEWNEIYLRYFSLRPADDGNTALKYALADVYGNSTPELFAFSDVDDGYIYGFSIFTIENNTVKKLFDSGIEFDNFALFTTNGGDLIMYTTNVLSSPAYARKNFSKLDFVSGAGQGAYEAKTQEVTPDVFDDMSEVLYYTDYSVFPQEYRFPQTPMSSMYRFFPRLIDKHSTI